MSLNSSKTSKSRNSRGREVSRRVTVQSSGQLVIGASYTKQMGLEPGAEFEIHIGQKYIHLKQIIDHSEEYDDQEED